MADAEQTVNTNYQQTEQPISKITALLKRLTAVQLVKKFLAFYITSRFAIIFTRA
jgi:hypothetical protein